MLFSGMAACVCVGNGVIVTPGALVRGKLAAMSGARSFVLTSLALTQQERTGQRN